MARFSGRRALVTGGGRGIGAALAHRLAAEGADVCVSDRAPRATDLVSTDVEATAARLTTFGGKVAAVLADLASEEERAALVPAAEAVLGGPLDILVNNAATAIYRPLASYEVRHVRRTFEVNVTAPLVLTQAALPGMVERGEGWVVNVSSGSRVPWSGPPFTDVGAALGTTLGIYAASKAAVARLSNALAVEVVGTGVRINSIEPRAAVLSDGADALVGGSLRPDQVESMEQMVEAMAALCDCPPEHTGQIEVSLDLIERLGLAVRTLDGRVA